MQSPPSAGVREVLGTLNSFKPRFLILDFNIIPGPNDLECAFSTIGSETGLLNLRLYLGADPETLIIVNEALLASTGS